MNQATIDFKKAWDAEAVAKIEALTTERDGLRAELEALKAKREPLSSDQVREVYRAAFPKGPYVFTNDAFVFARMIENAHGINGIGAD